VVFVALAGTAQLTRITVISAFYINRQHSHENAHLFVYTINCYLHVFVVLKLTFAGSKLSKLIFVLKFTTVCDLSGAG